MTVDLALRSAAKRIESALGLDLRVAHLEASVLLAHVLKTDRASLIRDADKGLVDEQALFFELLIEKREAAYPVAYLTKVKEFFGLDFSVNEDVLIPRPETEELVELLLQEYDESKELSLLDIGTGSAAIAVTIKKLRPRFQVHALDISEAALRLAKENCRRIVGEGAVRFIYADMLSYSFDKCYDVIVSNPPYVSDEDMLELSADVLKEPETALRGGEEGNDYLLHMPDIFSKCLKDGGAFFLETHAKLIDKVLERFENKGYNVRVEKDLSNRSRFIKGEKPCYSQSKT